MHFEEKHVHSCVHADVAFAVGGMPMEHGADNFFAKITFSQFESVQWGSSCQCHVTADEVRDYG